MTYIQSNNNKINFWVSLIAASAVSLAVWGVFLYNQVVNLRYETADYEKRIRSAEVENAELKNNFYQTINSQNFESLANSNGLVLEKNPQYVSDKSLAANH